MNDHAGAVIVQRNEGLLLRLNVAHHLSIGFARIVIVDNQSDDPTTLALLSDMAADPRVDVIYDGSDQCDQAALANFGLARMLDFEDVHWVFPLDADEFLWCNSSLPTFLFECRRDGILYGTLPWLNHLPERYATAATLEYVREGWFHFPSSERPWQQPGHFRKAFCARHDGMNIVVGGHYFRWEANPVFFGALAHCPEDLPATTATIVHFDVRDCTHMLLHKLHNLSSRHVTSGVPADGPWREKEALLGRLWWNYRQSPERLFSDFAESRRTLWGNSIPPSSLQRRTDINAALGNLLSGLSNHMAVNTGSDGRNRGGPPSL